jgi:deuterolysin
VNVTFDLAELFDLGEGGQFEIQAEGGIPWAKKKSTKLVGTAPYKTNKLMVDVEPTHLLSTKFGQRKTMLQSDCIASRLDVSLRANAVCSMLSSMAAQAAVTGDKEQ